MDLKCIGKRIREKRIEHSWSQEELAEKANLSPVYIGMIERGEKIPKMETFIRIANILMVTSDDLLQDVLFQEYKIKISKYMDEVEKLDNCDRKRLYRIIEAYLRT